VSQAEIYLSRKIDYFTSEENIEIMAVPTKGSIGTFVRSTIDNLITVANVNVE
jgi:hypothetical protein